MVSKVALRAQVFGDVIDVGSHHADLWDALPDKDDPRVKMIVLGDLVHRNSPERLWAREWQPRWGTLPTAKVWSVLGNHGWGWSHGSRLPAARGRTYWKYRRDFHEKTPMVARSGFNWAKRRPGWLILGLDTEHPTGAYLFMRRVLRSHGRGRRVLVLMHRPPILPPGSNAPPLRHPPLKRLVARKADLVMSGHSHRYWRSGKYVVAGTGDGKGWVDLTLTPGGVYRLRYVPVKKGKR